MGQPTHHEVFFRDTVHGFLALALASVLVVAFATSSISSAVSSAGRAISNVAGSAASTATQAAANQSSCFNGYFVDAEDAVRRLTVLLRARAASSVVKHPHRAPQGRDQLQQRRQRPRASARQRKDAGDGVTRLCAARRAELVGRFRVFSFGGFLGIGEKLSFPWIALLQPCGSSRSRPARAQRRFVRQRGERNCWITRGPEGATGVQIYRS